MSKFSSSHAPAWRADVAREYMRLTRVFNEGAPHPAVINRSIDCLRLPSFYFLYPDGDSPCSCSWLGMAAGGFSGAKKNRDTGLRLIGYHRVYIDRTMQREQDAKL